MKLQYKEFPGKVVNFDDATLTITHFISTETQDSGGDVMKAAGMKIRLFGCTQPFFNTCAANAE